MSHKRPTKYRPMDTSPSKACLLCKQDLQVFARYGSEICSQACLDLKVSKLRGLGVDEFMLSRWERTFSACVQRK